MVAKKSKRKRLPKIRKHVRRVVCLDCNVHSSHAVLSSIHPDYCVHFTPEYWVGKGYERDWGDAAVMNWPNLEILRKEAGQDCEFLVLARTPNGVRLSFTPAIHVPGVVINRRPIISQENQAKQP